MTIVNPFFQFENWETALSGDPRGPGNQIPSGWTLIVTQQGQPMPWSTKHSAEGDVAALAGGPGEYVHKLAGQLPPDEQTGQPRSLLVLPLANKVYKCFGNIPQAVQIQQVIREPAGTVKKYSLYVLAETQNQPTPPHTTLEDDHWRVALTLGDVGFQSNYAGMKNVRAIAGNERAWNIITVTATFPVGGVLTLTITCQQNWLGGTDFFVAGIVEETVSSPTPPPANGGGVPTDPSTGSGLALLTTLVTALDIRIQIARSVVDGLEADRDSILTELLRLRNLG